MQADNTGKFLAKLFDDIRRLKFILTGIYVKHWNYFRKPYQKKHLLSKIRKCPNLAKKSLGTVLLNVFT